ncbi:MAG TPA: flavin reductase family protein [Acidimicrobiales bacterium]|jgi:flavin reductase (DIM6/NTAB) family NADH-FMN oxidoreductase RutF
MSGQDSTNQDGTAGSEFDRQRRRLLWSLPTGLYLIGSRHEDAVNLMTANLVVQVCLEPKLVGAAIEAGSVTAGLVEASGAFSLSLLARTDKDVVRRFVKPVTEIERAPDGSLVSMSGHAVREVGESPPLPILASAVGHLVCAVTTRESLGSHTFFIGEVTGVGGEPADVLRMEDTRMHYGG